MKLHRGRPRGARLDPAVARFIEGMGREARTEQLARTAARMFAYLLVAGGPLSAEELAETLGVSRGGLSMSARRLESLGLIVRTSEPGDQRAFYQIAQDPFGNLITSSLDRRRRIRALVAETRQALASRAPRKRVEALARLQRMETFYDLLIGRMEGFLDIWNTESP